MYFNLFLDSGNTKSHKIMIIPMFSEVLAYLSGVLVFEAILKWRPTLFSQDLEYH